MKVSILSGSDLKEKKDYFGFLKGLLIGAIVIVVWSATLAIVMIY